MPVGQRLLEHFGQGLLGVSLHVRHGAEFDFREPRIGIGSVNDQAEIPGRRRRQRNHDGCSGVEADIERRVVAVELELRQTPILITFANLKFGRRIDRVVVRINLE